MDKAELAAALNAVVAIGSTIRDAGTDGAPAGILYAGCLHVLSHGQFERVIQILVDGGMVARQGHVLRWVGGPWAIESTFADGSRETSGRYDTREDAQREAHEASVALGTDAPTYRVVQGGGQ